MFLLDFWHIINILLNWNVVLINIQKYIQYTIFIQTEWLRDQEHSIVDISTIFNSVNGEDSISVIWTDVLSILIHLIIWYECNVHK